MLVDFVCVLPPKQVQTQSCSVGVLLVLVASVQNAWNLVGLGGVGLTGWSEAHRQQVGPETDARNMKS